MNHVGLLSALVAASVFASSQGWAQSAADIRGFAPVSVSSVNYSKLSRDEMVKAVEAPNAVNPTSVSLKPLAQPVHFVFLPGEIFASDLKYEDVCEMLTPSLAEKGYLNAADRVGLIKEPGKVKIVLRVTFGVRNWRLPKVRTENLTWYDGMQSRPRGRTLTTLGGEVVSENRAGGDDFALAAAAANENNTNTVFSGGSPKSQAAALPVEVASSTGVLYGGTREFNLIVIDAFDYAELKTKGKQAKRLWTTFVASPVERGKKFSDVAVTLIRSATTQWGESTTGLQIFTDARAEVKIGEAVVVPDTAK